MRQPKDTEFFSPLEEGERRNRLRRLDDLLAVLEELNLRAQGELPGTFRERLLREGIPVKTDSNVTDLIETVLSSQEQYMLHERRAPGRRRRRLSYIPSDDELVSVLSNRFSR
ncbi:MAG: hypothetical protein ACYDGR_08695 [Candidatus Dormibacteria bacterium]